MNLNFKNTNVKASSCISRYFCYAGLHSQQQPIRCFAIQNLVPQTSEAQTSVPTNANQTESKTTRGSKSHSFSLIT